MKILITSIVDLKNSQHNRPHQFVKYLSEKHDITILSINDHWKASQGNLRNYASEFDDAFKDVNIIHLTKRKISPVLQEAFSLMKVKEIIKEGFDVHLNYSTLSTGYIAAREINTVYDIADDLGAMIRASPQIPRFLRPIGGVVGDILIKRNIDIAQKVTVTTETLINSYNIPKIKAEVIPNGVDTELFRDYGGIKREELNLNGFIIGYVGVLREWVNFEPVFISLKDLDKNIKMLVVGREGRLKENIELAKRCGVKDRVIFPGMVTYSEVPKFISAMDVCLIPFQKGDISENALPLKLFEYMACSRPVISTELSGVKRAVGNRVLYAANSEDYKNQILKLYNSERMRYNLGKSGRRLVESKYEWVNIVGRLEKVLIESAK